VQGHRRVRNAEGSRPQSSGRAQERLTAPSLPRTFPLPSLVGLEADPSPDKGRSSVPRRKSQHKVIVLAESGLTGWKQEHSAPKTGLHSHNRGAVFSAIASLKFNLSA